MLWACLYAAGDTEDSGVSGDSEAPLTGTVPGAAGQEWAGRRGRDSRSPCQADRCAPPSGQWGWGPEGRAGGPARDTQAADRVPKQPRVPGGNSGRERGRGAGRMIQNIRIWGWGEVAEF